ncbi:MAG TPA: alginate export family protein [Steroidobacter sp.]|nr:alginate export family protein [Steroidobacter sp.]
MALIGALAGPNVQAASLDCPLRPFRWQEDCGAIAHSEAALGWRRLRGIPLGSERSSWLTLGGEYRFRVETLEPPSFGLRGETYTARDHRWFVHADLHAAAGPRLFVQLSAAADDGRKPAARPFDHSALDIAQAFADLPLTSGDNQFLFRLGRQELDLHGNRLVSTRDAANLRRAFDMALASFTRGRLSALAFAGRPVRNDASAFDDAAAENERFAGASFDLASPRVGGTDTFTLLYFDRTRALAVYQDAIGSERRHTLGMRVVRTAAGWDGALQAAYQSGHVATQRVRAHGLAGDVGWRPAGWALRPRFGVSFGYASGDRAAGDDAVGTFDVLYPNLGYFTDAPVFYPGNTADFQPNISAGLNAVTLQIGCDFIYRVEATDAVYEPPGVPLVRGNGAGKHAAATLCFGKAVWRPTPAVELTAAYVHARPEDVLRTGGGSSTDYWLAQLALRL